jgi:RNA polymerase sigma-70 factor, ECF subfamily
MRCWRAGVWRQDFVLRSVVENPLKGVNAESVSTPYGEASLADDQTKTTDFAGFVAANERGLRQSLTAALGSDAGRDATAEALAYGWENWDRVEGLDNPAGYLYRVGLNWGKKRNSRRFIAFSDMSIGDAEWFEPGLPEALAALSEKQRIVVYLVHGHDWSLAEVAELLGVAKGTIQKHMERGMAKLRRQLKVES